MVGGSFFHIRPYPSSSESRQPSTHTRASTERAVPSGQTPEASPGAASAVMRDAHVRAIRQLASRGLSIEEIAPAQEKQKSRRAATQRLLAELCSY